MELNRASQIGTRSYRSQHRQPGRRQRGVVLLSVLLIVALLTAITVRLVSRHSLYVAQTAHSAGADLTLNYAVGSEILARQLLFADFSELGKDVDNLTEVWAQPLAPFPLEEYNNAFMEIQIRDLNSCFNLNSLAFEDAGGENVLRFKRLLGLLGLPETIADAWKDWVDGDDQVSAFGAEDGEYLLQEPAYLPANQLAAHVSELRLLADLDPEHATVLEPHVCTLPTADLDINVNTAGAVVLTALSDDASAEGQLEGIEEQERVFENENEFKDAFPAMIGVVDGIGTTSQYFEILTRVQIDGNVSELATVIKRDSVDGRMTIVARNLGKSFKTRFQEEDS